MFRRIDAIEYAWCLRLNRGCHRDVLRKLFVVVSRLGDGLFWYAFAALRPILYGAAGQRAFLRMLVAGLCGVLLYKWLKNRLVRERPCVSLIGIVRGTPPLDRYSFPSGHTLHAVSFSTLIVESFPALAWVCVPFAALVAISRVVLGLHYPTDVAAGALIGFALAGSAIVLI
jgi:undecaprenyl-diphosphatase